MTERNRYLFPKEDNAGSNPVGRTNSRLTRAVLEMLFACGPVLRWDDLWHMLPDHLRAYPYSYTDYTSVIDSLYHSGWVTHHVPWMTVGLTAMAWLKMGIGEYPWHYQQ